MSKKVVKSEVKRVYPKREINLGNNNGKKNLNPSSSDLNSQDRAKDYKLQQINSEDELLNFGNEANLGKFQYFDTDILSEYQLQRVNETALSKDRNMLYFVTFLAKNNPKIQKNCICNSRDMKTIEERTKRQYRYQYLDYYLSNSLQ